MRYDLLDHGYVRHVESWGGGDFGNGCRCDRNGDYVGADNECGIIEAARQSTQGSFRGWDHVENCKRCGAHISSPNLDTTNTCRSPKGHDFTGDEKLLRDLYTLKHSGPFEFAGMTIEVQAPIMVFREWHRHRTQSYNEMSGRYTELPNLMYVPDEHRMASAGANTINKQGSGGYLQPGVTDGCRRIMMDHFRDCRIRYEMLLAEGVAKEIARLVLPVSQYSRMRATANLRNWLAFLTLRMDPAAQWEIRQYANAVGQIVSQQFPRTWALFTGEV